MFNFIHFSLDSPVVEVSKFEPFPELEPFPFKPDPPAPKKEKKPVPVIRKPAKFVRGESRESDYESDLEGAKIRPRWTPAGSESEEASTSYKKIKVKLVSPSPADQDGRKSAVQKQAKEPTPPSQFDVPPKMEGPPRPTVLSDEVVSSLIQAKTEATVHSKPIRPESVR